MEFEDELNAIEMPSYNVKFLPNSGFVTSGDLISIAENVDDPSTSSPTKGSVFNPSISSPKRKIAAYRRAMRDKNDSGKRVKRLSKDPTLPF